MPVREETGLWNTKDSAGNVKKGMNGYRIGRCITGWLRGTLGKQEGWAFAVSLDRQGSERSRTTSEERPVMKMNTFGCTRSPQAADPL